MTEEQKSITLVCKTDTEYEQARAMLHIFKVFQERNASYQDAWRPGGLLANMVKLRLKVERAWRQLWVAKQMPMDDLADVVNYAIFCIRLEGDLEGGWEWGGDETP